MLGERCSLCNGKLNSKKICKECGLDNSKSEKYYKVNQSSCDHLPMTHVHEELRTDKKTKAKENMNKKMQRTEADRTKKKGVLSVVPTVLVLVSIVFGLVGNLTDSYESEPDYDTEALYNPYEYLGNEHPEEGDTISYSLGAGEYIVGVHIAPGNYWAEVSDELSDTIEVADNENSIYLYANASNEEGIYLDDLRLFEGAVVTIYTQDTVFLQTENGQTGKIPALAENFITESYMLQSDTEAVAGKDFEPGIYDLSVDKNYGYVSLTIYDENGEECAFRGYDMGTDGVYGSYFHNVVIPEGAVALCENVSIKLIPSEWIWTTDYLGHYH